MAWWFQFTLDLRVSHRFDICNETICSSLAAFSNSPALPNPLTVLFLTFIEFQIIFRTFFCVSFVSLAFFSFLYSAFPLSSLDSFSGSKLMPEADVSAAIFFSYFLLAFFQVLHDICYANKIIRADLARCPLPPSLYCLTRTWRSKNNGRTCWPFIMCSEWGGVQ